MNTPLEILQTYWQHPSFREPQEEIIDALLAKKNVIALLPTGGGKSICFQIPALILDGICLVVSPLIALMQDQVQQLAEKNIKAASIPSGMSEDDMITFFDNLRFGNYKFLYLSPERLQSSFIQQKIKQLSISLIAIDEAHCISEWGHDFRPSYRLTKILKTLQPSANWIALTASANEKIIEDIESNLELDEVILFKKSFYRENLAYQFFNTEDKLGKLLQIFTKTKAPAIVYVKSRNKTKEIATFLEANGFLANHYHGGMTSSEKQVAFNDWMDEKKPIMVATNAFGMGIDKSNVKVVIHLDIPSTIENYVQEAGRAGRSGAKAFSVVLYNANDIRVAKEQLSLQIPSLSEVKNCYKKLCVFFQIAQGELPETTFDFNINAFADRYQMRPITLNTILQLLVNNGLIHISDHHQKYSTLEIIASKNTILKSSSLKNNKGALLKNILRSYGGLFEQASKINEYWLAKKTKLPVQVVYELLTQMHNEDLILYQKASAVAKLTFLTPREDDKSINRSGNNIEAYLEQKKRKLAEMLLFIDTDNVCRSKQILSYFGETKSKPCGICDVCLRSKNNSITNPEEILELLKTSGPLDSKQIYLHLEQPEKVVLVNLRHLLAEELIAVNASNQYYST